MIIGEKCKGEKQRIKGRKKRLCTLIATLSPYPSHLLPLLSSRHHRHHCCHLWWSSLFYHPFTPPFTTHFIDTVPKNSPLGWKLPCAFLFFHFLSFATSYLDLVADIVAHYCDPKVLTTILNFHLNLDPQPPSPIAFHPLNLLDPR